MAGEDIIRVTIVGSDADQGDVRLSDFVEQLGAIKDALRETELALYGREAHGLDFRIVGLSRSSPATVLLAPLAPRGYAAKSKAVAKRFVSSLTAIQNKRKPPANADLATLESYRDIAKPLQKHVQRVEIAVRKAPVVSIDRSFQETVQDVIGPDVRSTGSVSGTLERINLHNTHAFDIYPLVGPRRVRCKFTEDQLEKVRLGLKRHVTVHGSLKYKTWDKFPYAIDVQSLDVHESDNELPSIFDIRGIAPDITGELSSEAFVRMIRENDW